MRSLKRYLAALLLLILFIGSGILLLRAGRYGWTIFVLLPVLLGGLASWTFRPTTAWRAVGLGALTVTAAACLLLLLALDGLWCIIMALPLLVPLGALGAWLAYRAGLADVSPRSAPMLLLLPFATLTWDAKAPPPVFEVQTQIIVRASPEQVWKQIIAFSELPEPHEWYFRTGLGYPKRSYIHGSGPGATRYCEFSTGNLVEPVEIWDQPRLLRFRVTQNPAPLHEWSLYSQVEPKHLHGYLVSKRGQFRLTRLPNGETLLEASTWYQHGFWPAEYWRLWSDAIIHRIHLRVLNHIRMLAERS